MADLVFEGCHFMTPWRRPFDGLRARWGVVACLPYITHRTRDATGFVNQIPGSVPIWRDILFLSMERLGLSEVFVSQALLGFRTTFGKQDFC